MRLCLCYHAVSPGWPAALSVTPEALREQLGLLVRRGYRGVTFTDLTRSQPRDRVVSVTFDDAYRSVHALAAPILRELGLPGTVFVPTAFAGSPEPMSWPGIDQWAGTEHEDELVPASWEELGSLARAGWEVGSHTRSHPRLTELGEDELELELAGSRHDVEERLGGRCTSLAYPYGDHDERVVRAAGRAGYEAAGTLPKRFHAARPLRWPRIGVYHVDDARRFRLKVSPALLRARRSPLWKVISAG